MRSIVLVVLSAGALASCGEGEPAGPQSEEMFAFMNDVMQVRAQVIWDSAGYVITAEGERDLSPTTDEGWEEVRLGAVAVREAGETLMTPQYAYDQENWIAFAEGIVDTGELLEEAAGDQDSEAIFELGAQLYRVCVSCHQFYRVGEFAEEE